MLKIDTNRIQSANPKKKVSHNFKAIDSFIPKFITLTIHFETLQEIDGRITQQGNRNFLNKITQDNFFSNSSVKVSQILRSSNALMRIMNETTTRYGRSRNNKISAFMQLVKVNTLK